MALAQINPFTGRELIPQEVLDRRPSADLAPGQEDPFDYPGRSPIWSILR